MSILSSIFVGAISLLLSSDYWTTSSKLSSVLWESPHIQVALNNNGYGLRVYAIDDTDTNIKFSIFYNNYWSSAIDLINDPNNKVKGIDLDLNESDQFSFSYVIFRNGNYDLLTFSAKIQDTKSISESRAFDNFPSDETNSCFEIINKIDSLGNILYVYKCSINSVNTLYSSYYNHSTGSIESEKLIDSNVNFFQKDGIDLDANGNFNLVYEKSGSIYTKKFDISTKTWSSSPILISLTGTSNLYPQLKVTNSGKIKYFWVEKASSNYKIGYRENSSGNLSSIFYPLNQSGFSIPGFDAAIDRKTDQVAILIREEELSDGYEKITSLYSSNPLSSWSEIKLAQTPSGEESSYYSPTILFGGSGNSLIAAWYYNNFSTKLSDLMTVEINVFPTKELNTRAVEKAWNLDLNYGLLHSDIYDDSSQCNPEDYVWYSPSEVSLALNVTNKILVGYEKAYTYNNSECGYEGYSAYSID